MPARTGGPPNLGAQEHVDGVVIEITHGGPGANARMRRTATARSNGYGLPGAHARVRARRQSRKSAFRGSRTQASKDARRSVRSHDSIGKVKPRLDCKATVIGNGFGNASTSDWFCSAIFRFEARLESEYVIEQAMVEEERSPYLDGMRHREIIDVTQELRCHVDAGLHQQRPLEVVRAGYRVRVDTADEAQRIIGITLRRW